MVQLDSKTFKTEVEDANGLVLVDFWAPWCGPCQALAPTIEQLAYELEGKVKVCKINVDENPEISMKYSVSGIPTVVLFKDGKVVETLVGYRPKEHYLKVINKYL